MNVWWPRGTLARMASDRDQPIEESRFVWPPRKPGTSVPATRVPAADPAAVSTLCVPPRRQSVWSAFEREVLGLTAGPLADRAAEAGWVPDEPAAYCSRCGQSTKPADRREGGCYRCEGIALAWERMVRLGEYRGELRRWIHEVKFTRWRRLGFDLGQELGRALAAHWGGRPAVASPVLVPIPDSALRRIWRGIDHAAVIAAGAHAATGWPIMHPLRRRWGRSQRAVPSSQRARNAAQAYGTRDGFEWANLAGRTVVLLDDVVTSGATMRVSARLIANACRRGVSQGLDLGPPQVWVGCLARTPLAEPGRPA